MSTFNQYSAELISNVAIQLTVVSVFGVTALIFLNRKSAPLRNLTAVGTLVSIFCVFMMSAAFYFSNIAWYKIDTSHLASKPAAKVSVPTFNPIVAPVKVKIAPPTTTMKKSLSSATVAIAKTTEPFRLTTTHCINLLGLLWGLGIIFMLLKLAWGLAFISGFRSGLNGVSDPMANILLKTAPQTFNQHYIPELYTSPRVESPVTIGLFRPIIIIPEKLFSALSENELKSILLHELAHIYHYDHIIGVIKRVAIAFNWWNPLVYFINKKHVLASEEIADNYVLRELSPKIYSQCLTGLVEKICLIGNFPAAAGMAGNYSSLEQRIKGILSKKRKLTMTAGLASKLAIATICGALTLLTAGVQGRPETIETAKQEPAVKPNRSAADSKPSAAETIIAKMAASYANCKTYQDSGEVKTIFISPDKNKNMVIEKIFTTFFVRPDRFRFEYWQKVDNFLKKEPGYIVWRKGNDVRTWFYARPELVRKSKSLLMAVAGATGVSSSSAHTIPALLMPEEVGGIRLSDMKDAKLLEDGMIDKVSCFRIQGHFVFKNSDENVVRHPTVIWIDKNSFLVRRIDKKTDFKKSNFITEGTTTYRPVTNQTIPDKMLEFNPPRGNKELKLEEERLSKSFFADPKNSGKNNMRDIETAKRLFRTGQFKTSAKEAMKLEQELVKNPDNEEAVVELLGYLESKYRNNKAAQQKREKYILWMVEHHPDSEIFSSYYVTLNSKLKAIEQTKKLWIQQTQKYPDNPQVFWNAGNSMFAIDKTLAKEFFLKGQKLDPDNPEWARRLGSVYFLLNQPEKSFEQYKQAYPKITKRISKISTLLRLASLAVDMGKLQEAEKYAFEMQSLAKNYGDQNANYPRLIFNSKLVLGRIALKQGNTDKAVKYLQEAGKTPDSLERADFTLCKELLAAEKKDAVVQFIQSCSQFWDKKKCENWINQIKAGKKPGFK